MFNFGRHQLYIEEKYEKYADFMGPSEVEEHDARIKAHMKLIKRHGQAAGQGSNDRFIGTPRRAKHRGLSIGGVRIK